MWQNENVKLKNPDPAISKYFSHRNKCINILECLLPHLKTVCNSKKLEIT